ncbi:hypothetical protein G3N58_17825 [Paraburkholderia sp. Ac-20342]|uniref:hypothetical protein n=1 Tax=Paraburkholderia sp. Ac-20342 TaxID=2703889 RepID=UPI00197FC2AA|nr:hypothetical protein [Paraburkholderia sp. Ac-20342]MBN3848668.1 hypothetical protein [Paraburkholderia sp. Ac-20342]
MSKPKIYVFSNVVGGGDGPCYAMAEDGTVVGSHYCSNEQWAIHDLGVTSDWHHEEYRAHYPDGYEMEFVPVANRDAHASLKAALELNARQAAAEAGAS